MASSRGCRLNKSPAAPRRRAGCRAGLRFVQISDSHIGFDKPANPDVTATLRAAIAKINAASEPPAFLLHTGDLTHLSKPAEFDTLQQVLTEVKARRCSMCPASTTSSRTTARAIWSDSARTRKALDGTASITPVCISLVW